MTPLIEIAAREYPDVSRANLAAKLRAIEEPWQWIDDERYRRAVVLLLLRAHLLDKASCVVAAARLIQVYKGETSHDRLH